MRRPARLLARDADAFLHQSLSRPASPPSQGRGHLDRGYGGPPLHGFPWQLGAPHRLWSSAPGRGDQGPAGRPALFAAPVHQRSVGGTGREVGGTGAGRFVESAVHHRRVGRRRSGAEDRARGDGPVQDAELLGCLPRRGLWRGLGRRRGHVPIAYRGAAHGRHGTCGTLSLLSLRLWASRPRELRTGLCPDGGLRAGARGRCGGGDRRTHARGAGGAPTGILEGGTRGLRPARRVADHRRDPHRAWQDRPHVRL